MVRTAEETRTGKDLPCEVCGKIVYVVPNRQPTFRACSKSCASKLSSVGTITNTCECCRNEFIVPFWRNRAKYCSQECYHTKKRKPRISVNCVVCGSNIERTACHLHKSGKNVCGPICRGALKRKVRPKNSGYARKWVQARGGAKECERCKFSDHPEILVVHHKDRNRGNNNPSNFEILCPNCHAIEHYVDRQNIVMEDERHAVDQVLQ